MDNRQTQVAEFIGTVNIIPERDKLLSVNTGDEGSRFLHKSTKRDNSNNKGHSLCRTYAEGIQSFHITIWSAILSKPRSPKHSWQEEFKPSLPYTHKTQFWYQVFCNWQFAKGLLIRNTFPKSDSELNSVCRLWPPRGSEGFRFGVQEQLNHVRSFQS